MALKTIHIRIEGVTPLLLNRFTDEAQQAATDGTRTSTVGENDSPREDAAQRLYLASVNGKNGKEIPVMPQPNLFKCVIEGGRFFKQGRSKITTQRSSLVPAAVMLTPEAMAIEHEDEWEVDTRPVRIPSTGGRILRHRPMFHDWAMGFDAQLDTDLISEKLFREIVDAAGQRIGLGDFRPDTKGPYGRFKVTEWKAAKGE